MRVLVIQPWIRQGGAELLSLQLAEALEREGDEAPIAALFVDPRGLPARALQRRYVLPPRWLAEWFSSSKRVSYLLGPLALLALVLRASRRCDVLNPHNLPAPLVAAIAGSVRRRPVVWTCNEVPAALPSAHAATLGRLEDMAWKVGAAATRLVARSPREILVLSEKTRSAVRAAYGRGSIVIRPGVDLADFEAAHQGSAGRFALLFVAKLHPQKDPLLAVRTLKAVRNAGIDAAMTIVGDGPDRPALDALVRQLDLGPYVHVEPRLELRRLVETYRTSDVLIVTAGGHQSWGLTPFEALAAGTPSVISPEAGAAELLGPADAALIAWRDATSFASAVVRLATEADLAPRLVANGRRLLRELTWDAYARACRAAYERASTLR